MPSPKPESAFTRPTSICPCPERWHAPDVEATEIEISDFVWGIVQGLRDRPRFFP